MFDTYSSDQKGRASAERSSGPGQLLSVLTAPLRDRPTVIIVTLMLATLTASLAAISGFQATLFVVALVWAIAANLLTFRLLSPVAANIKSRLFASNVIAKRSILAIGATAVSFGPLLTSAATGSYMVLSSLAAERAVFNEQIERLPGTPYYTGRRADEQSKAVKEAVRDVRLTTSQNVEADSATTVSAASSKETPIGGTLPTAQTIRPRDFIVRFLALPAPMIAASFIFLIWGIIFFPATCFVAVQTGSFRDTISPLIALEKIRHVGREYLALATTSLVATLLAGIAALAIAVGVTTVITPDLASQLAILGVSVIAFYTFAVIVGLTSVGIQKNAVTAFPLR